MNILIQPMYSRQEINGDSNYIVLTSLVKGMSVVRPKWRFAVLFPDSNSGFKYVDDGFFRWPNVRRVPMRVSTRKLANAVSFDGDFYDKLFRTYCFNAVISFLPEISSNIKFSGHGTYNDFSRPLIVNQHTYVIHPSLPYPVDSMENVMVAQIMGAVCADYNIFISRHCAKMFEEMASVYLNESILMRALSKSIIIPEGTIEYELRCVDPQIDPSVGPIIAYNHRLQAYKNFKDTFEVLNELHSEGYKFKVKFMSSNHDRLGEVSIYPFVEICLSQTRAEYLAHLRKCHMNVTNSQYETFCIAAAESMALGQALVAPKAATFPEITGLSMLPSTDYPYLFNSTKDQKNLLRELLTPGSGYASIKKWGKKLASRTEMCYTNTIWAENVARLVQHLEDCLVEPESDKDAQEFFEQTIANTLGKPVDEVWSAVSHKVVGGRMPFGTQSMAMTKMLRKAERVGFECVFDGAKQVFKRKVG